MEEKMSQENATEAIETAIDVDDKESTVESAISAIDDNGPSSETESDILSRTEEHRRNYAPSFFSESDIDIRRIYIPSPKEHRKSIDKIIVPQYIDDQNVNDNNYVVTYSRDDNSFLGWKINIEENGQQQPDVYFKLDNDYSTAKGFRFALYEKTLSFCYYCDCNFTKDSKIYLIYAKIYYNKISF